MQSLKTDINSQSDSWLHKGIREQTIASNAWINKRKRGFLFYERRRKRTKEGNPESQGTMCR